MILAIFDLQVAARYGQLNFASSGLWVQMTATLDIRLGQLYLFFIYKSPPYFQPSFESIGLSVQEKKRKIYFEDGSHGSYLGFPNGTILATFDLQIYQVSSHLAQGCKSVVF